MTVVLNESPAQVTVESTSPALVTVTIAEQGPAGPGGPSTEWGDIAGTLSDQTDLQGALDGKQDALGFTPLQASDLAGSTITPATSTLDLTLVGTALQADDLAGDTITPATGALDLRFGTAAYAAITAFATAAQGANADTAYGWGNHATAGYQAALVSGTNLKTVNSTSLLGSGDIAVSASPGGSEGQLQYNSSNTFAGSNLYQGTNLIEMRNSTNPQSLYSYQSYTDGSNYKRSIYGFDGSGYLKIGTQAAGTGVATAPPVNFISAVPDSASAVAYTFDTAVSLANASAKLLSLKNNGTEKIYIGKIGNLVLSPDNTSNNYINFGSTSGPSFEGFGGFGMALPANTNFRWRFAGNMSAAGNLLTTFWQPPSGMTNSSGEAVLLAIYNKVNSSGTASNIEILVDRTNTAHGSGEQRLLDLRVGGSSVFGVDVTGMPIIAGSKIRVATSNTPVLASDTGTTGDMCWDADYVYVCTAANTWKRAAIATW